MDISSSRPEKDRISQLPDEILFHCLSLLEIKNASQTSTLSKRWRYLWTYSTNLDFDHKDMFPEEFGSFQDEKFELRKYFACVNKVVGMHRCPSVDKFRVHFRYVYTTQLDEWVKFALSKRVKELVLDLMDGMMPRDYSRKEYSLGLDLVRHPPCYSGFTSLQSLHLCNVIVSQEFVEFVLSHCVHLERLYISTFQLSNFKVKTSKLKYLTIITRNNGLEELEIDAPNLLYIKYIDGYNQGGPRMVFKNLPMLVEADFGGGFCQYPFPIFQKLSFFSTQLCKLCIDTGFELMRRDAVLIIPDGVIPTFPNVKYFTCTSLSFPNSCILSMKRFIEACPMLEEFQLQVIYMYPLATEEAIELQEIDLEDEKKNVETEIDLKYDHNNLEKRGEVPEAEVENMKEENQSHANLKILKLVGFLGVRTEVQLALAVVSYACSLNMIICETRSNRYTGTPSEYDVEMRARKLAQIVAPKVKVVTTQSDI